MIDRNFKYGDRVQLTDSKGKLYSITLSAGSEWHTHKGVLKHETLVGLPEGSIVATSGELKFQAFRPLLADYVLSMPRGATIVYPKDAAMIIGIADIKPGIKVLEAGVGSGALSISILRAVGESGYLHSVEIRDEEASSAASIIGAKFRINLGLEDGFVFNNKENQIEVIKAIRHYKPDIILSPTQIDRHSDHGKASDLIYEAAFLSGLSKLNTASFILKPNFMAILMNNSLVTPLIPT